MIRFKVELHHAENEDLEIPFHLNSFTIEAYDIEDAVIRLDKHLFSFHLTNATNDYSCYYNYAETKCKVSFSDDEKGMALIYTISQ